MNINWKLFPLVAGISATELVAMSMLRKYSDTKQKRYLAGGVLGYSVVALQVPGLIGQTGMGLANVFWNGCSSVLGVVVGSAVFRENLYTKDLIGIPLTLIGAMAIASEAHHDDQGFCIADINLTRNPMTN